MFIRILEKSGVERQKLACGVPGAVSILNAALKGVMTPSKTSSVRFSTRAGVDTVDVPVPLPTH